MKILLVALAAAPLVAAAAPAAAQYRDRTDAGIDTQISQLQTRLRAGIAHKKISTREAQPLRAQLRDLTLVERQYRRDGFSRSEKTDLESRMRTLSQQIRLADDGRYRPDQRRGG
ncbi:MAG: hypothetical protein ACXWUP_06495 [Allosphingosinicella sp.]